MPKRRVPEGSYVKYGVWGARLATDTKILTGRRTLATVAPLFHCCEQSSRLPAM